VHVAVVGAGALGRVYGARLQVYAGATVTYVVRTMSRAPFVLERVDERDDAIRIDAPARATEIPGDADVLVVCVRAEQTDARLLALARQSEAPIVVVTPMMPSDYARLRAELGTRLVAAMPSAVAYVRHDDVVRYWLPRVAHTLVDESGPVDEATRELVHLLERAGFQPRLELGVHESNPATTVTFLPLMMALDAGHGVERLLGDDALVDLAIRAAGEGHELARKIGKAAPWAALLLKFVTKTTLKLGVGLAKQKSPEAIFYVEEHFGRKLHAQNIAMARAIVELAKSKGTPHAALEELAERLTCDRNDHGAGR
jgi:2-dehydropantoate 2-reductase